MCIRDRTTGRLLAKMLHYRVKSVLRRSLPILPVLIEDTQSQRRSQDLIRDAEHLIELDCLLQLDRTIDEDESFELNAEHVWQLADELLVSRSHGSPVVLIVVQSALLEVSGQAGLDGLGPIARDFEVQYEEWLI